MSTRCRDGVAALLFLTTLLISAGRLSATDWTAGLDFVALTALGGAVLGLLLGISRFHPGSVIALAAGYTVLILPWAFALQQYPDLRGTERLSALGWRWQNAFATLAAQQPLEDTFLFVTLVASGYWCFGLVGGFGLTRQASFSLAAWPAGVSLVVIQAFDPQRLGGGAYLFLYLLAALFLLARLRFLARRAEWQGAGIYLPIEAIHDWNLAMALTVIITLTLVWSMPAPAQAVGFARRVWQHWTRDWQNRETDFSRLVAGLQVSERSLTYAGEIVTLEREAVQATDQVFTVRLPPENHVARYYWRVRVYDFYSDGRWETRDVIYRRFSPAEAPRSLPTETDIFSTYLFTLQMPAEQLFTPLRPRWVSLPARLALAAEAPDTVEPFFFQASLNTGQEYRVQALDVAPTEAQLRAAGQDYPAWIRERYLQLPADFPVRLRLLATELTADAPTPYDKAQAITDWLRASLRYSEHLPPPPEGEDILEWFLFDVRQGFCTYYASAQVVLLRAVGVPARLAIGYAEGEIPPGTRRVRQVRQNHAHAWPEVYFPGLGWVEFEPTPAQSPLRRPAGEETVGNQPVPQSPLARPATATPIAGDAPLTQAAEEKPLLARNLRRWSWVVLLFALVAPALGYLLWKQRRDRRIVTRLFLRLRAFYQQSREALSGRLLAWAPRPGRPPIQQACAELYRAARRLGIPLSPARTPLEIADLLRNRLPEAAAAIAALLDACLPAIYGPETGNWDAARRAATMLRRLSRRTVWRKRLHMD